MEFLQTIWTALTTKNELMLKLTTFPMIIIELTLSVLIFTTILNINSNKNQKILYVFILSVIGIVNIWFIPTPYNTFVNLIACPILVLIIFRTNILKAVLAEIIPYIIFVISTSISVSLYVKILGIVSNDELLSIPIHKLVYSIATYLFIFFLYLLCKKFNLNITLLDKMKKKNNLILIINFIVGTFSIALQAFFIVKYIDTLPIILSICNISALLIYFCISFYSLIRTSKLEQTTQNLEEEKLYNKTLTILHDNIRGFKHDFNNIVQAIGGYVSNKNIEGLKEYYNELVDDCQRVNNLSILNPDIINNPAIYSLLTSKYYTAEELGIKMNIEVFIDLNSINMKIYELTRILGILLDNAIEASKECNERIINISIRNDIKLNRQLIIVENTYLNKEVNIDKIFEKGYTSKQNEIGSHGLGLWEVRQVLKKNNNLNLHTTKNDKYFKQQLEIYN